MKTSPLPRLWYITTAYSRRVGVGFLALAFYERVLPSLLAFLEEDEPDATCEHEYASIWEERARQIICTEGNLLDELLFIKVGEVAVARWETDIPERFRRVCTPPSYILVHPWTDIEEPQNSL